MRRGLLALACAGAVSQGAFAFAETWTVVDGRLKEKGGSNATLSGSFDASLLAGEGEDASAVGMRVDAFAFRAGRRDLAPRVPVEYQGLEPIAWLQRADSIRIEGEQVTSVLLRSGGKLVQQKPDMLTRRTVTFRFLELRADASHGGYVVGHLDDSELPRRLVLKGDVYDVRQTFSLPDIVACSRPPGTGSSAGGSGSGGVIVTGSAGVQNRVTGAPSEISGALVTSNAMLTGVTMRFDTVRYYSLALDGPPSLELLGISAPDGAVVQADANGGVRVSSQGDLYVERLPTAPISDLTSVTISTRGNITLTGPLGLGDASLRVEAGGQIRINSLDDQIIPDDQFEVLDPVSATVGLPDFCQGLRPEITDAKRTGSFSLVASAARQVKIQVRPEPKEKRIRPGSDQQLRVVVFGSRNLDVHDIDREGRLLGRGEAEPLDPSLRLFMPINGDSFRDLVTLFAVRDAEIAFGDREVCLFARTLDGHPLEGCDEIDTRPGGLSGR